MVIEDAVFFNDNENGFNEVTFIFVCSSTLVDSHGSPSPLTKKTHSFKLSRLHRAELCALCNKSLTGILVQGYKCTSKPLITSEMQTLHHFLSMSQFFPKIKLLASFPLLPSAFICVKIRFIPQELNRLFLIIAT